MPRRFIPGQKITTLPGGALNAAMDLAERAHLLGQRPGPEASGRGGARPYLAVPFQSTIDAVLKERSIVGIAEPAFDLPAITGGEDGDLADTVTLTSEAVDVELPDAAVHTGGQWGVTLGPAAALGTGWLAVAGLVKCRVDRTDAGHTCARLKDGETDYLESGSAGVPVTKWGLDGESDELGLQWCQINLGPPTASILRGTVDPTAPAVSGYKRLTGVQIAGSVATADTWISCTLSSPENAAAPADYELVYAVYRPAIGTIAADPPTIPDDITVDWEMIPINGYGLVATITVGVVPARSGPSLGSLAVDVAGDTAGTGGIYRVIDGELELYDGTGEGPPGVFNSPSLLNPYPHTLGPGAYPVRRLPTTGEYLIYGLDLSGLPDIASAPAKVLGKLAGGDIGWATSQDAGEVPAWVFDYETDPISGGTGTDELVKCSSNDTTAKYIEGVFPDSSTNAYTADKDLLVTFETQNDGNNETQKAFVSRKDIPNYSGANTAHLGFAAMISDAVVWLPCTLAASKEYLIKVTTDASAIPTLTAVEIPTTGDSKWLGYKEGTGFGFHAFGAGCTT